MEDAHGKGTTLRKEKEYTKKRHTTEKGHTMERKHIRRGEAHGEVTNW